MDEFFQLFYQIASMNFPDNTRIFEVTNKLKKISDQKLISILTETSSSDGEL